MQQLVELLLHDATLGYALQLLKFQLLFAGACIVSRCMKA